MESPLAEEHPWTTATLKSGSFAVTRPPHVSLHFDLILPHRPFQAASLVAASAIASCVSGLPHVTSKSSDEEKQKFLARVEWLPVTSRLYVTHALTHRRTTVRLVHRLQLSRIGISGTVPDFKHLSRLPEGSATCLLLVPDEGQTLA